MRNKPSKEDLQDLLIKNRYNPSVGDYRGIVGVRYGLEIDEVVFFRDDFATTAEIYTDKNEWVSFLDDVSNLPTLDQYDEVMQYLEEWLDEHSDS